MSLPRLDGFGMRGFAPGHNLALMFAIAVAVSLGGADAFAQAGAQLGGQAGASGKPIAIAATSMVVRPDAMQLQAMIIDWIRITVSSTPFVVGAVAGMILAEAGRFLLRWLGRTLSFVGGTFRLIVHYRLIFATVVAASGWAIAHFQFGWI